VAEGEIPIGWVVTAQERLTGCHRSFGPYPNEHLAHEAMNRWAEELADERLGVSLEVSPLLPPDLIAAPEGYQPDEETGLVGHPDGPGERW
jgi:hypothetical protein